MYVTYDLAQETRGNRRRLYPKVKRIYLAGEVRAWRLGTLQKRTGRRAHGLKVEYEQSREAYERKAYTAARGRTAYRVSPARVHRSASRFVKIIEVPKEARNIRFHARGLPQRYRSALQDVR